VTATSHYRFSFDIGGTFTDLVLYDEMSGRLDVRKELTDVANPGDPIIRGLRALLEERGATPTDVKEVVCGATTLVTNLVIERKGAPTALLTTRGFRDILEMRREGRYDLYDLSARYPAPLVPRSCRLEVSERMDSDGTVVQPLTESEVHEAAAAIRDLDIGSIAVCLLHSYANDTHEKKIEAILREALPDLPVSLSSEVAPEIREFERLSSTVLNAYVKPFIGSYFRALEDELHQIGLRARLHIMQSNGGILDTQEVERVPIRLLESGPAAGAIAAAKFGTLIDCPDLISFDMGGTTAKTCLVHGGSPSITYEFDTARVDRFVKGSGFPVRLPTVDLIEIGAGGGSIARIDAMGLLKVGPESASASPGPACYSAGGTEPTVTDANLVLGYLNPDYFLAGRMQLDRRKAEQVIQERIASRLGMSVDDAASGIFRVINENMANAAKIHVAEKGKDPRKLTLFAFGGAGPVHAREIARRLGISKVVVPLSAGVFSALGLLLAPLSVDLALTHFEMLDDMDWPEVKAHFKSLEDKASDILISAGGAVSDLALHRSIDVRFVGQGHELNVTLEDSFDDQTGNRVRDRFNDSYAELFGRTLAGVPIEALNLRLKASCSLGEFDAIGATTSPTVTDESPSGSRTVFVSELNCHQEVPVYDHRQLQAGAVIAGPAVVEQRESTIVAGPGDRLCLDELRNLVIELGGAKLENADVA